jgi:hypothetical protein
MSNEGYDKLIPKLPDEPMDMHLAITSLVKALEAVDWYSQRVEACKSDELRAILVHSQDEEIEHAAMVLEWIRRHDHTFTAELENHLFTKKTIAGG